MDKEKEFEEILKESLLPETRASESLDRQILEKVAAGEGATEVGKKKKHKWARLTLPKVAAIVLVVLAVGAGTVYAASQVIKQPTIKGRSIYLSTKNDPDMEAYLERVAQEDYTTITPTRTLISDELPGPSDHWISKQVYREELDGAYPITTRYEDTKYDDYKTAVDDYGFHNFLGKKLKKAKVISVVYNECVVEKPATAVGSGYREIQTRIFYSGGYVHLSQLHAIKQEAEVTSERDHLGTVQTYVSKSGAEFTLVEYMSEEEGKVQYVGFVFGEEVVTLEFTNMSLQDIHGFLDGLNLETK